MTPRYLIALSVLLLSSCTTIDVKPPITTDTGALGQTGVVLTGIVFTGSIVLSGRVNTGSVDHQPPLTENLSGSGDAYYPIFQGLETKIIPVKHTTGVETKVAFINAQAKSMHVVVTFPGTATGNLRLAQIVMPDGQMDGPFGTDTTIELTQF